MMCKYFLHQEKRHLIWKWVHTNSVLNFTEKHLSFWLCLMAAWCLDGDQLPRAGRCPQGSAPIHWCLPLSKVFAKHPTLTARFIPHLPHTQVEMTTKNRGPVAIMVSFEGFPGTLHRNADSQCGHPCFMEEQTEAWRETCPVDLVCGNRVKV